MTEPRSDETMSRAIRTAHNYHDWVFDGFASYLRPGTAIEIGSGHGMFARRLLDRVDRLVVSDIDPLAVERVREELADLDARGERVEYLVMDGIDVARVGRPVDNIVLLNVLEHIRDDAGFLARCHDALAPGGRVIVFAPAFAALYSRMDREAGHFRRYEKADLVALLERAGYTVEHVRYFNAVGFAGWFVNKLMKSGIQSTSTNLQVRAYDAVIPILRHVDRWVPFVGQSLIAVATRGA